MLRLRRGIVTATNPLTVRVGSEQRRAWADEGMVGEIREGDELIVNVAALDLDLGSGGFDVVHANLSRGLEAPPNGDADVVKLNYTSLQHPVEPVETRSPRNGPSNAREDRLGARRRIPVLVLALHGQLAPATWAAGRAASGIRVGYVQTGGGALPGTLSSDVAELRRTGLLCGQITAAPAYGGELEALSVAGALDAAAGALGWDAAIAGPGPGIIGSATALGHGGLAALDTAHASLALGFETILAPRMSNADTRRRHRGLSHHTETVLELLLRGVRVPVPAVDRDLLPPDRGIADDPIGRLRRACGTRHELEQREIDIGGYAESGVPATTMGRGLSDDRLFFAAALAAGDAVGAAALAEAAR